MSQAQEHRILGQGLQCQQMKVEGQGSSECREVQLQAAFMQMPSSSLLGQRAKGQDGRIVEALLESAPNQCCAVWVLESEKHALCNAA